MAGAATSAAITQTTSHVTAAAARLFPPGKVVPAAVVLAVAVGLVSMLPSLAQAVWEVPHLFVLGLVISYGVFTQRNTDAEHAGHCDGNVVATRDGGALAWNARYRPDEPLIVVADHDSTREGALERPLSLPVRRLKQSPPPTQTESDTASDGCVGDEETESSASSAMFCAGGRTAPSPPSVLDADLGLSPCSSQPQSPPFFANSNVTTKSRSFSGYEHPYMARDEEDGEVSDWDEEEEEEEEVDASDEMTVSSERSSSARGDYVVTACANDRTDGDGEEEEDDMFVEEELLKLASRAVPEGMEEEVDRKADEFIAKFREQIRLQKL